MPWSVEETPTTRTKNNDYAVLGVLVSASFFHRSAQQRLLPAGRQGK
jgi:hypothetical protein